MRSSILRFPLFCLALVASVAVSAAPLLTPAELDALLPDDMVRVVDTRGDDDFAQAHIPGAVSAPYGQWRGPASNPGELVPMDQLTTLVQALGLTPQTHAVIVYAGRNSTDFGSAARVYWTLKSLGMARLSVLNGGLKAWQAAGLPVTTQAADVAPSSWQPQFNDQWLATRDEVRDLLGNGHTLLVDARPAPYFEGHKAHPAAGAWGTLPGAVNLDNARFFKPGSAALMSPAELAQVAQSLQQAPGEDAVSFCNTGHWAATEWFVLSEVLGESNMRLYPGSMVDWTQARTPLPMANEPGRVMQLAYKISNWIKGD